MVLISSVERPCKKPEVTFPAHKVAVLASTAGKANGVLSEMYADSDEAGETGNHPARTRDGPACEIRTCARAGSAEQAPQPMDEENSEPSREQACLSTPAISGHSLNSCFSPLMRRIMSRQRMRTTR